MDMAGLTLHLLLEKGQSDRAFSIAAHYLKRIPDEFATVSLSQKFDVAGKAKDALLLLAPFTGKPEDRSPLFLQQLVSLQQKIGHDDDAYALLASLSAKGKLPDALVPSLVDLAILYLVGAVGCAMRAYDIPLVPAVLGLVLGPLSELQFRRAMAISEGDISVLLTRPISAVLLLAAALLLVGSKLVTKKLVSA